MLPTKPSANGVSSSIATEKAKQATGLQLVRSKGNDEHTEEQKAKEEQEFKYFPSLPPELRILILGHAVPKQRMLLLEIHLETLANHVYTFSKAHTLTSLTLEPDWQSCRDPSLLSVCKESRQHYLHQYQNVLPAVNGGTINDNAKRTVVYIENWDERSIRGDRLYLTF